MDEPDVEYILDPLNYSEMRNNSNMRYFLQVGNDQIFSVDTTTYGVFGQRVCEVVDQPKRFPFEVRNRLLSVFNEFINLEDNNYDDFIVNELKADIPFLKEIFGNSFVERHIMPLFKRQ